MIVDIPFNFGATASLHGRQGPCPLVMSGREALLVATLGSDQAPVTVRWRPSGGGPWSCIREVDGRHAQPLWGEGVPQASARAMLLKLLREGWDGEDADPVPAGEHVDLNDFRILRLLDDDKGRRVESLRRRAARLTLVDGVPHVACEEPVLVEAGGSVELRIGGTPDWMRVHPLVDPAAAAAAAHRSGGDGTVLHHVEVLRPERLQVDRAFILGRVVRKALILVRRACEADDAARTEAEAAEAALTSGSNLTAALAMDRCLAVLSDGYATAQNIRDFAMRTRRYLCEHLAPRTNLAAA